MNSVISPLISRLGRGRFIIWGWFCLAWLGLVILYGTWRSPWLDDFDSVSFALALRHYDLHLQQPHPPGFPVYIGAAQLVQTMVHDPQVALTWLSVISGAVGALAIGGLARSLFPTVRWLGILSMIGLAFWPAYWLHSAIPLSDVPGLAAVLVAGWLLSQPRRPRLFVTGGLLAGLALGVRPQNGLPLALIVVYSLFQMRPWIASHRRRWLFMLTLGGLAVISWLMAVSQASGGLTDYLALVRQHGQHVYQVDSLLGQPINGLAVQQRLAAFMAGWQALCGSSSSLASLLSAMLILGLVASLLLKRPTTAVWLCLGWALSSALQVFLLESLERPRLYLPILPPLILLTMYGWSQLAARIRQRWIAMLPAAAILVGSLLVTLPLVRVLHTVAPAPQQAASYIQQHYAAAESVIVSQGSFRHLQYYLPDYHQLYTGQFDAATWAADLQQRQPRWLILVDRDDLWLAAAEALTSTGDYVPVEDRTFVRDARVFPQHVTVRVQVLTPKQLVSPEQLALPADGSIRMSDPQAGKYLATGWYRVEDIFGGQRRWTQQQATLQVALLPRDYTLILDAVPIRDGQRVEVSVNGHVLSEVVIQIGQPTSLVVPASAIGGAPISTIVLHHTLVEQPADSDRQLAAAYASFTFVPR